LFFVLYFHIFIILILFKRDNLNKKILIARNYLLGSAEASE